MRMMEHLGFRSSRQSFRVAVACSPRARIFPWGTFTACWPADRFFRWLHE